MSLETDESALAALDAYLQKLHAGQKPSRDDVLSKNPDLASALDCLEALENLAPAASSVPTIQLPAAANAPSATGSLSGDFGKFELLQEIGRGGMGVVYKARQKDLGRLVALKMILAGELASAEVLERFRDEARAAAAVQHPNITAVYDVGQILGQPYIAIQYVDGPSLAQRLRDGPLPPETAAGVVAAIARAVQHLHANGFIHRDLKPSNILLDAQGQPYVTDFGLVKMLQGDSRKTSTGAILGTPSYMSPEQAAGRGGEVGPASDIYSIGAMLYECLTGRPPFREATPLDTLVQVLEGEPATPRDVKPTVPRALESICLRCLEKSPQRRYPTASAIADNLERYLKGDEVEGLTPGLLPRLGRWARREPALVSRLSAFVICCVLIQVNFFVAGNVDLAMHLVVTGLLLAWGGVSFLCQRLLNTGRWDEDVPFAWAAADMLLWTIVLIVDNEAPISPILGGYACLIAASGLWFRVRLVWFVTVLSLLSYGVVLAFYLMNDKPVISGPHHHLIFAVTLVVIGSVVSYQVNRVRALSRYYERRPLP